MSTGRSFYIAFVAFAATMVYVTDAARPHKELVLEVITNNTMCPIKVHINDDPNRTPQEIRFLQCAEQPNQLCTEKRVSDLCCKSKRAEFYTECVEAHDYVQVQYRGSSEPDLIRVPVGCFCLIGEPIKATEPM